MNGNREKNGPEKEAGRFRDVRSRVLFDLISAESGEGMEVSGTEETLELGESGVLETKRVSRFVFQDGRIGADPSEGVMCTVCSKIFKEAWVQCCRCRRALCLDHFVKRGDGMMMCPVCADRYDRQVERISAMGGIAVSVVLLLLLLLFMKGCLF